MSTWTPQDLTNPAFVANMPANSRNAALVSQQQNIGEMTRIRDRNQAELNQVDDQLNNGPLSFSSVRQARALAREAEADPNISADRKAELQRNYETIANQRASLQDRQSQLTRAVESGTEGIRTAELGVSTLSNAGATSNFNPNTTPPPNQPNDPPQQQEGPPPGTPPPGPGQVNAVPNSTGDEFGDLDSAIADQEGTGLKEPPVLSDEETDDYLNSFQNEEPGISEPPFPDDEDGVLRTPDGREETGESAETGLREPTEEDVQASINASRTSGNAPPTPFPEAYDWRVRIHLPPSSDYLYNSQSPGILEPLKSTDGVLFPYTPQINIVYNASYDASDVAHSNYKIYNYKNSSVDAINITADFTAQDTYEANYVLAVIHFFRSVTKMFYGQDSNPVRGTPPPMVYLTGHGTYQFNYHPMVITSFSLNLPNDVDYINAGPGVGGTTGLSYYKPANVPEQKNILTRLNRLFASQLQPGGLPPPPKFTQLSQGQNKENTRVPTKLQIQLSALPIVTRNAISNNFSLKEYATGKLLQGSLRAGKGGGIW